MEIAPSTHQETPVTPGPPCGIVQDSIADGIEGRRALVVGRASVDVGSAFEFRHDLYDCDALECGWTEVSIPNFTSPPFNAVSNTVLYDAAWRPGCDGGIFLHGIGVVWACRDV
ncbi:MAG: hypothetical protein AAFX99_33520, partial [Myxococcota bacterium]